jgi:hypothetical protein
MVPTDDDVLVGDQAIGDLGHVLFEDLDSVEVGALFLEGDSLSGSDQVGHQVGAGVPRVPGQPRTDGAKTDEAFRRLVWSVEMQNVNSRAWVIVLQCGIDVFVVESSCEHASTELGC